MGEVGTQKIRIEQKPVDVTAYGLPKFSIHDSWGLECWKKLDGINPFGEIPYSNFNFNIVVTFERLKHLKTRRGRPR